MAKVEIEPVQPIAVRPNQAAEMVGCSRDLIFEEIAAGRLVARKVSPRNTVIEVPELTRWVRSFPTTVEARQGVAA
jgi:hypothetical protein